MNRELCASGADRSDVTLDVTQFGNRLFAGGDLISVTVEGPVAVAAVTAEAWVWGGDRYEAKAAITVAGAYSLRVAGVDGKSGAPQQLTVSAAVLLLRPPLQLYRHCSVTVPSPYGYRPVAPARHTTRTM
eukprot:6809982-Pyramimonas_sp.AAC.2